MTSDSCTTKNQAIRIKRLHMASASYLLQLSVVALTALLGAMPWNAAIAYMAAIALIVALFYTIFLSGVNLRFTEPSLTFVQVLAPALPGLFLLYHVEWPDVRTGILLTVIVPLLYGMLELSTRRFLAAAFLYFAGYSLMFALMAWQDPSHLYATGEWIVLITLAVLLVQIGLIGGFISRLRKTLRRKNLELKAAMRRISDMAVRDVLTGVFNRRRLIDVLAREVARSARGHERFSVCLMDIDHFKRINDGHGHLVGDRVLERCALTIEQAVRDIDTFGRYGGEEFLLVMPMTGADAACIAAHRICTLIEGLELVDDAQNTFNVTLSVGVATSWLESGLGTGAILRRADRALYRAKSAGRNCVRFDEDDKATHATDMPRNRPT